MSSTVFQELQRGYNHLAGQLTDCQEQLALSEERAAFYREQANDLAVTLADTMTKLAALQPPVARYAGEAWGAVYVDDGE